MNYEEILEQVKSAYPFYEGEDKTWLNPNTIVATYNVPFDVAVKVANEYNSDIVVGQLKTGTSRLEDMKEQGLDPSIIATKFNISMDLATMIVEKYDQVKESSIKR